MVEQFIPLREFIRHSFHGGAERPRASYGYGPIIWHHQRSARFFLGRMLVLRQYISPGCGRMTDIDLPCVRHKAGIKRWRPVSDMRS